MMYSTIIQPKAASFRIAITFLATVVFIAKWAVNWFVNPLRKVPGPQIASLTDIWRYLEMSERFFCGYHVQVCADLGFGIEIIQTLSFND